MENKEEMKTLKDIKQFEIDNKLFLVNGNELKAEAVKWAKHGINKKGIYNTDFVEFFNLTEEDFK